MIVAALLLASLGIVVIYSSSETLAIQQFVYVLFGLAGYFLVSNADYRIIKNFDKMFYVLILFLLVIVFVLGIETRGSLRWIPLGPFNLQPSEFAKIALILGLAHFWSNNLPNWINIGKSLFLVSPLIFLVFRQPDLGTTLTLVFIWLMMAIFAGISASKIFLLSFMSIFFTPLLWLLLKSYQKQRIISFLFPTQDPLGLGYNVIQSTVAVGSGGFLGRGLGRGTQSRLQFLPEFRTDFIFAFIAEELGLIGSAIVLILYGIIFFLIFNKLNMVEDSYCQLIIIGVLSMFFFQIIVNIGMNTGVLPITGITLPLLSYGGSSMITVLLSLGLVSSVSKLGRKNYEIDTFGKYR